MDPRDSDFSPYFESLSKQKRICPKCHERPIMLKHSLSPNGAYESCECGYIQSISATSKAAEVEWDCKTPWSKPYAKRTANAIRLDAIITDEDR